MQIHQPVITTNGGVRATWVEVNLTRLSSEFKGHSCPCCTGKSNDYCKGQCLRTRLGGGGKTSLLEADYIGVAVLEEGIFFVNWVLLPPSLSWWNLG